MLSTTFGFLSPESVNKLHKHDIMVIGNATSYDGVVFLLENKADAVILQGTEAGGHQSSFLSNNKNELSSLDLLDLVRAKHKDITLIVAGGISFENLATYFKHGANYVQLGTAFMLTNQSLLPESIKNYIVNKGSNNTVLTKDITGKYARGVKNQLIKDLLDYTKGADINNEVYAFPLQHYATSKLRAFAKQNNNPEYVSLWCGSNPQNLQTLDLEVLLTKLQKAYGLALQ